MDEMRDEGPRGTPSIEEAAQAIHAGRRFGESLYPVIKLAEERTQYDVELPHRAAFIEGAIYGACSTVYLQGTPADDFYGMTADLATLFESAKAWRSWLANDFESAATTSGEKEVTP